MKNLFFCLIVIFLSFQTYGYDLLSSVTATGTFPSKNEIKRAAEQGDVASQYFLALSYSSEQNEKEAIKWFLKSANKGYAASQFALGNCYKNGVGVDVDMREAVKWYEKAAMQGYEDALYELGVFYYYGEGVDKDLKMTANLWKKAAQKEHILSQLMLAQLYIDGKGVDKNLVESANLFERAARNGSSIAQYKLSSCYYYGNGVKKDKIKSYAWCFLSSLSGNEDANKTMKTMGKSLTPTQIFRALKLAEDYTNGNFDANITSEKPTWKEWLFIRFLK